jgi:uncharacterized protein YciI
MSTDEPRITRTEILKATQNMLQLQLYVVHTTPTSGMGPVMANLEAHLAYQVKMEEAGIYVAAGPHWEDDEETWKGDGMIVVRAKNLAEAHQVAEDDPMHSSGARKFTVRPWLVNEGTVSVRLNFSTGRYQVL